ncbi:ABC transporter ATP-binding protein [Clostridium sp. Ade.TY]|uniref:ABC transporter ATP-binding protein n=1 Tax=Clostridium sp. Ade.TY TaxID=1391647 RepID=UPI0003FED08A|nr:ABC transporter ATP-binding protein [Clostridium sp. Ade.TY]
MNYFLKVNNYNKKIKNNEILKDINLNLSKGKIYGLKGHNGSGKSMLMRAMAGIMFPTSGEVIINGENITKEKRVYENIGILIESPGFIDSLTGYDNLMMLADIKEKIGATEIREWMKKFDLNSEDKRKVKEYSLGMKQKLGIIQALMENPDIIFLDEPINALDEKSIEIFNKEIINLRELGKLIVISNHNKDELENICDEIIELEEGRIKNKRTI